MQNTFLRFIALPFAAVFFQCSLIADDTAALMDRLHAAVSASALDGGDIKPWHLLMSFQLLDAKNGLKESGTIEEWWAAPKLYKVVYQSPSYTNEEITNSEGNYKKFPDLYPPEALSLAIDQIVHPMPERSEIDQSKPDLRKEVIAKVPLDCIMLDQKIAQVAYPPMGLCPTYCFDRDKNSLRISLTNGSVLVVRNAVGLFQGKSVAISQSVSIDNLPVIKAHIEKLTGAELAAPDFMPTSAMALIDDHPTQLPGNVVAGTNIKKVNPVYPQGAKEKHVSGTVVLHALIGTDGRIHHLNLVSSPDPDLALASFAAVRYWTYKPYLLNGRPTWVDTTITVNFSFAR